MIGCLRQGARRKLCTRLSCCRPHEHTTTFIRTAARLSSSLDEHSTPALELKQGSVTEAATPQTQGFYDNVAFESPTAVLPRLQPELVKVKLLPFQQEGVAWMAEREAHFTGGIMADHLGMGKTIQMVSLCVAAAHPNRLRMVAKKATKTTPQQRQQQDGQGRASEGGKSADRGAGGGRRLTSPSNESAQPSRGQKCIQEKNTKYIGYRYITVIRQMQKVSAVGNCSRITRPGKDLFGIVHAIEKKLKKFTSEYDDIAADMKPWLDFCERYNPGFARRARSFLDDEGAASFDDADSPELRTLIVLPASIILQWKAEIQRIVDPRLNVSVFLYHGAKRALTLEEMESHDFVLTSYETVGIGAQPHFQRVVGDRPSAGRGKIMRLESQGGHSENDYFDRAGAGPLFQARWKRIILDEAHMIRHGDTRRWRAISQLQGRKKWAVTATPLHNTIEDLQNLLSFIHSPKLPLIQSQSADLLLKDPVLQRSITRALQPVFLRRGPTMIRNGVREILVKLPEKQERIEVGELTEEEVIVYNDILLRSQHQIQSMAREQKTMHMFAMMTRLRQVCCHPWLADGKAVHVYQCGICKGEAVQVVLTKCGHSFCRECLLSKFTMAEEEYESKWRDGMAKDGIPEASARQKDEPLLGVGMLEAAEQAMASVRVPCPTCNFVLPYSVFKQTYVSSQAHIAALKKKPWQTSAKLTLLLDSLRQLFEQYPGDKVVVFSQFTSFLDIIGVALEREKITCARLDGTMTIKERNTVIHQFDGDKLCKVLLASKMAIGIGLNLTMANHVIVVDPWWNPAIEEQAVHRCYRIGQTKDVTIQRIIMGSTVEQYCYEVCKRKSNLGQAVLEAVTGHGGTQAEKAYSRLSELIAKVHILGDNAKK